VRIAKVGEVRFALSRPLPSEPSSVTLTRSASGAWHVSFVVAVPDRDPLLETGHVAGIDLGLTDLAAIAYSACTREQVASPRHPRDGRASPAPASPGAQAGPRPASAGSPTEGLCEPGQVPREGRPHPREGRRPPAGPPSQARLPDRPREPSGRPGGALGRGAR